MPGPSLQELQATFDDWWKAYQAASTGSSYSIGGRSLTRADVTEIRNTLTHINRCIQSVQGKSVVLTPNWNT